MQNRLNQKNYNKNNARMKLSISFPHPPIALSPNSKVPLQPRAAAGMNARKMRAKMDTRNAAFVRALAATKEAPQRNFPARTVAVSWYYKLGVPPDVDNVVARLKPILDGCAQAFGMNDRDFESITVRRVKTLGPLAGTLDLIFDTEVPQEGDTEQC